MMYCALLVTHVRLRGKRFTGLFNRLSGLQ
jgi:hypothetical protein